MEPIGTVAAYAPLRQSLGGQSVRCAALTGMQALERIAHTKLMRSGQDERREFEDSRPGTRRLIANFAVATGQIGTPSLGPRRPEADFAAHVAQTIATDPDAVWLFITDQLNTHQSESLVRLVAQRCLIADDWGEKGTRGSLQSLPSRAAFVSDPRHRMQCVDVPNHTSWLNQVERWCSILVRRALKRGTCASVDALQERILACIAYGNQTAKPFRWTYTGRPRTM